MRFNPFFVRSKLSPFGVWLIDVIRKCNRDIKPIPHDIEESGRLYDLYYDNKHFLQINLIPVGEELSVEIVRLRFGQAIPDVIWALDMALEQSKDKFGRTFRIGELGTQNFYLSNGMKLEPVPPKNDKQAPKSKRIPKKDVKFYPPEMVHTEEYSGKLHYYVIKYYCPMDVLELEDKIELTHQDAPEIIEPERVIPSPMPEPVRISKASERSGRAKYTPENMPNHYHEVLKKYKEYAQNTQKKPQKNYMHDIKQENGNYLGGRTVKDIVKKLKNWKLIIEE